MAQANNQDTTKTQADPIFAAIGAHRAATAGVYAICDATTRLEIELPGDKRGSFISVVGEEIVATDDQRWIDCGRAALLAYEVQDDAAVELLKVRPTTLAGVKALLLYAKKVNVEFDGWGWPELTDDDGYQRPWQYFLVESVAAAIPQCA